MSPTVPVPVSPRASITITSPGPRVSNARFCALYPPPWLSNRSVRKGTKRSVRARPTNERSGRVERSPSIDTSS